ncbi:MAG TPA: CotH kinase family protein [Vicinamibacterales bacterium]|nr:CotH kinase family protein [Vicinamibacterales bacterium]
MRVLLSRRVAGAWLVACTLGVAAPAAAQSQDALFDDTVLHDLQLTVSERDWNTLKANADQNTYYPADLRWRGVTVRNIGIRSRGTSSRNSVKPGLRLDMNRYVDQEFLGLGALVLDNAYTDPSTLRDALAMKVFARAGLPASREAHARLFVNNEYAGVYVIVEPIDRRFITRVFGAAEGNVENGGYLYEYTWVREYGFEYLGPSFDAYAELFEPETRETDAVIRLYQPLETLARAISETPSDQFEGTVGGLIDLPALVKFLAVQRATGEIDGFIGNWGMSNFYLYRFRDGRPALVLPWDADHAFWALDDPIDHRLDTNLLVRRAMSVPALRRLYLEVLASTARLVTEAPDANGSGWLEREVDRLSALVSAAVATDPAAPFTFPEFEGNVRGMRGFLRTRPLYIECAARAALDPTAPQSCPLPVYVEVPPPGRLPR